MGRARALAALALVVVLAAGWVVTARMDRTSGASPAAAPAAGPRRHPVGAPTIDVDRALLRAVVPAAARCGAGTGDADVRCTLAGVSVDYRLVGAASVTSAYFDAIGSIPSRSGSGPATCTRGVGDERAWSRTSQPRRVAGRFACRIEHGRAAMWWTVADRGLLVHAVAPDAHLASLFAWWLSHSER